MVIPGQPLALRVLRCLLIISALVWSVEAECTATDEICEYWLQVQNGLTMMSDGVAVYAQGGQLYNYDDDSASRPINADDVITADGWGDHRLVLAVNGSIPAPTIEVWVNQTVVVHVTNLMYMETATIHWHGLPQWGTPWMDGVPWVTQCPIEPGQTFTYRFKAFPSGTFWYHSHVGSQLAMGVVGAFIIHNQQDTPLFEHILMVQEWNHIYDAQYMTAQLEFGAFQNRTRIEDTKSIDGTSFSLFPFDSGLINGRGRYHAPNGDILTEAPLTTYSVTPGQTYRFRMIGSGSVYPFRVSVDDHSLTVVATDGYDVVPTVVDAIIINLGERYDFLVEANQPVGRYWIRAQTLEVNVDHFMEAILEYTGAQGPVGEANSLAKNCSASNRCTVLNCPFLHYPVDYFSDCVKVVDLDSKVQYEAPGANLPNEEVHDIFVNFAFPGTTETPPSANGRSYAHPPVSSLTQPKDIPDTCGPEFCGEDKICYCPYSITLEHDKVYQFVLMSIGKGRGMTHPIHMHGHSYTVVKQGYPSYDPVTGQVGPDSTDIDCRGRLDFCNDAAWANHSWGGNSVPGLKMNSPPRKDTISVPSGGYVVIRIKADNPGAWFMHCHIIAHAENGMALVLNESFSRVPPPPVGFPTCGNFLYDQKAKNDTKDGDHHNGEECFSTKTLFWIIVGHLIFFVGLTILLVVVVIILCKRSPRKEKGYQTNTQDTNFNPVFDGNDTAVTANERL